jgi:hypothetical protein
MNVVGLESHHVMKGDELYVERQCSIAYSMFMIVRVRMPSFGNVYAIKSIMYDLVD